KSVNTISGLLSSRDLIYFFIVITSFLLFTIIKIKGTTESVSVGTKVLRYAAVTAVAFALAYLSSRPSFIVYKDATRSQLHTISPYSQRLLQRFNQGKLKLTLYVNLLQPRFAILNPSYQNRIKRDFEAY